MKLTIEGSPEEIKNVLDAIKGSGEHEDAVTKVVRLEKALSNIVPATRYRGL